MEGIYFEVKRKSDSKQEHVGSQTEGYPLHAQLPQSGLEDGDKEVQYRLQLVGSLPVHPLTTMPMLPWIVAEIRRPRDHEKSGGGAKAGVCALRDQPVCLRISGSAVRCCLDAAPQRVWDPLQHAVLFEYRPHHIHKLIHNSQEPSYFGCLAREQSRSTCHVLRCEDHSTVRESRSNCNGEMLPAWPAEMLPAWPAARHDAYRTEEEQHRVVTLGKE